jgi:hypothetical protein
MYLSAEIMYLSAKVYSKNALKLLINRVLKGIPKRLRVIKIL